MHLYKNYSSNFTLDPSGFIVFKSISLLKNLNKLFKSLIFFEHSIFTPNTTLIALSIVVKYIKNYLKYIFNIVSKKLIPKLALIIFLKDS